MSSTTLIQGEGKNIRFTYKDSDGEVIDVSSDTFSFVVKENLGDSTSIITKADGVFDKTDAATGIVLVNVNDTDTNNTALTYKAQVTRLVTASTDIDKKIFDFIITDDV